MRQTNVKWIVLGMAALAAGLFAMRPLASSAQEGEGQPGGATPAMQPASPMTAMPMQCMKALAEVK